MIMHARNHITPDSALGGWQMKRSLRWETGSYLYRTGSSPTGGGKYSYSSWIKRVKLGEQTCLWGAGGGSQTNTHAEGIYITSADQIALIYRGAVGGGSIGWYAYAAPKLRDTTSWMHVVLTYDNTQSGITNKIKYYFNGVEASYGGGVGSPGDLEFVNKSGVTQYIGRMDQGAGPGYARVYQAETHVADGYIWSPDDFGYTDAQTGQWRPKRPQDISVNYGNNGFYLDYADNTSTSTIGIDRSGNSNNWTSSGFSVSAGAGNDSLEDIPTNNFCTLNPVIGRGGNSLDFTNGNLDFTISPSSTYPKPVSSVQIPTSGKWYAEWVFTTIGSAVVGVGNVDKAEESGGANQLNGINLLYNGDIRVNDSQTQGSFTSWSVNDVIGVKVDRDAGTVAFTLNGSAQGNPESISSMNTPTDLVFWAYRNAGGGTNPVGSVNFGQRPFSHLPTGYRSLNSKNRATPVPAGVVNPRRHFDIITYTGSDASAARTVTGLEFAPDLVWQKRRNGTNWNTWHDTVRGATKTLYTNSDTAEATNNQYGYISAFGSNGFTWSPGSTNNSDGNETSGTFVSWCWKAGGAAVSNSEGTITAQVSANSEAGFSIISYTGNGTAGATIGHGLGAIPQVVMVKRRNTAEDWMVGIGPILGSGEEGHYVKLNSSASTATGNGPFNSTNPTSSLVTLGSDVATNNSGDTYIAYCWAEIPGYSKFGKYTGNGNANGPFVNLGFRPAWIMTKRTDGGSQNWLIHDIKRDPFNVANKKLAPNLSYEENNSSYIGNSSNDIIDIVSNGFKMRSGNNHTNINEGTFIYMAFAETPSGTMFGLDANAR